MTARFWILQAVGAVLFVAAWFMGWPQWMHQADSTHITDAIAGIAVFGVVCAGAGRWSSVEFLIRALPRYGLFGTLAGLGIVFMHMGGDVSVLLGGVGTAFITSIAGLIGSEWLRWTKLLS